MFGIATNLEQSEFSNEGRPVLAQPSLLNSSNQQKLLQVEFETNPIDKKSDYRVKILTQSLEIKYNAVRFDFLENLNLLQKFFFFSQRLIN